MVKNAVSKLLIIEDDPYVRRFYQRLFKFQKYEVDMAENGEDGVEKAISLQPNLILLDIIMPVMDGLTALKKLKSNPKTEHIPVIMLTNVGEEKSMKEAMSHDADGFLVKADFSPEQVLGEVNKYIQ